MPRTRPREDRGGAAAELKAQDVTVISIASTNPVRNHLAQAASPNPATGEDYLFCAASGGERADIFKTAVAQVSTGIRLVKLPSGRPCTAVG